MKATQSDIANVEILNDANVRVTFSDGTTLRMSQVAYENGSWQKGTDIRLVREVYES